MRSFEPEPGADSRRPDTGDPRPAGALCADPEHVRDLWREHRRWVAAILLAHMPRSGGAELDDLLQEVAVTMLRKIHELRDPALVRPWLRTVAANVARTAGRKQRLRLRLVRPAPEESVLESGAGAAPADPVQFHAGAQDEARRALDAAQQLHPDYAEPLLMRCVRGMTYVQIAEALGVPVTTIETRLARARRMLREQLEESEAAPAGATRAG